MIAGLRKWWRSLDEPSMAYTLHESKPDGAYVCDDCGEFCRHEYHRIADAFKKKHKDCPRYMFFTGTRFSVRERVKGMKEFGNEAR